MKKILLTVIMSCISLFYGSVSAYAASGWSTDNKLSFGIFLNYNIPTGDFDDMVDSALSGGAKVGYDFSEILGAELGFQRHTFAGIDRDDISIDCFRLSLLYKLDTSVNFDPYFSAGVGYYATDAKGVKDNPGVNFGVGFTSDLDEMFALNFSGNYHVIFNEDDYKFFEARAGVDVSF